MFSISDPITNAEEAVQYYTKYYAEENIGRWFGEGAKSLGLPEIVSSETFRYMLLGYSPDGSRELVKNAGAEDRTCGWDFTLSAPKPFSALWAILPERERKELEAVHREAVEITLKIAEEMFGVVRRGKGGKIHEKAGLAIAVFDEFTSRANDMQMHSHCVLANTGVTQDGKTGALHSVNFFRAKMLLGAVYQTQLAALSKERLHLSITPEREGFAIEGVPKDFCRAQSKRRVAIEKVMKVRGLVSAQAAKVAAQDTRPQKQHVNLEKLFPIWHDAAKSFGWGPEQASKLLRSQPQKITTKQSFEQAAKKAVSQIKIENQTQRNVFRAVKHAAFDHGVSGKRLLKVLEGMRLPGGQPLVYQPAHKAKKLTQSKGTSKQKRAVKTKQEPSTESKHQTKEPEIKRDLKPAVPVAEIRSEEKIITWEIQKQQTKTGERNERTTSESKQEKKPEKSEEKSRTRSQGKKAGADKTSENHKSANSQRRAKEQKSKPEKPYNPSRAQRRRNLEFTRQFGAAVDRIFPEKQTRIRLSRLANHLARKHQPDFQTMKKTLKNIVPYEERRLIHVESPRLFPHSPVDFLKWLRVPKIAVGDKPRKWGEITWKKKLPIGELRIQKNRLFPKAPKWSPLHGLEIPALRFSIKRSKYPTSQKTKGTAKQAASQTQKKKKSQSQSQ